MLGGSVVISVVMGGVVGVTVGGGSVQEPVYYQERRLDVILRNGMVYVHTYRCPCPTCMHSGILQWIQLYTVHVTHVYAH